MGETGAGMKQLSLIQGSAFSCASEKGVRSLLSKRTGEGRRRITEISLSKLLNVLLAPTEHLVN